MDRETQEFVDNADELNGKTARETIATLSGLWDEFGFSSNERRTRLEMVCHHLKVLRNQMVEEESDALQTLKELTSDKLEEIAELNRELGNPVYQYKGPAQWLPKEKIVAQDLRVLKEAKESRMVELFQLKQAEEELCDKLVQQPAYVSSEKIPTSSDLQLIRENIRKLEKLKSDRWEEFRSLKRNIAQSCDLMGETPDESLTRHVIGQEADSFCAVNPENLEDLRNAKAELDERREKRTLEKQHFEQQIIIVARRLQRPPEYMAKIQRSDLSTDWLLKLKAELEKLQEEKRAKLAELVQCCREEMANLWDKMYYSQEQREEFVVYYSEDYSEGLLTQHENECTNLNQKYEDHKNMFCGVDQWTELFQKYREMKAREKDPNRFKNNRGGALLKQQKEMAALKKRLPKLEEELIGDIQEWEKEHERTFLVDGVAFVGYINSQWAALSENDQIEKAERCKKRKQQLAVDMVFGTVTPTKSRFGSTQNLTNMSKRSRIDASVMSAVSKIAKIPGFNRLTKKTESPRTPTRTDKFETRKLRRRSKSVNELCRPSSAAKPKASTRFQQFRTPQPATRPASRLPRMVSQTEKKPKQKGFFRRREVEVEPPILENMEEDKENSFNFHTPDEINPFPGGPTSIRSAPVFEDAGPMSYEDFGSGIDKRHARSSAIGTFGFNGVSYES